MKAISVPTNYQVVTLTDRLVFLTLSFKNRNVCCCVWLFLTLQTFNKSQNILVVKYQCCLYTVFILVAVKVKDSCCATISYSQTLLVPSSYKQDIKMPVACTALGRAINTVPQALCIVWFSLGDLMIWTVGCETPSTLLGFEFCVIEK